MLVLGTLAMLLVSCGTSAPRYNYKDCLLYTSDAADD